MLTSHTKCKKLRLKSSRKQTDVTQRTELAEPAAKTINIDTNRDRNKTQRNKNVVLDCAMTVTSSAAACAEAPTISHQPGGVPQVGSCVCRTGCLAASVVLTACCSWPSEMTLRRHAIEMPWIRPGSGSTWTHLCVWSCWDHASSGQQSHN